MIFIDIGMFFLILVLLYLAPKYMKYRKSNYGFESKNSFFTTIFDKGNYGEFLTFSYLENLDVYNKIMTNLYIPKEDGKLTEIDLIMISETGIYVFESKNYSGWIFGNEKHRHWTQSFKNNQKYKFYNPIWQNRGHINALKRILSIDDKNICKSYIVFSERCELKNINVYSENVKVLKRNFLIKNIENHIKKSDSIITKKRIDQLYFKLQEFAYVDESIKKEHIKNVKEY